MFFSNQLLAPKTPLGKIWIVAHGRKLNRKGLSSVSVQSACQSIVNPEVPLALRLVGILMGGVVRIYQNQQKCLLDDYKDLMRKLQIVYMQDITSTVLDASKEKARYDSITLADAGGGGGDTPSAAGLAAGEAQAFWELSFYDDGTPGGVDLGEDFFVMKPMVMEDIPEDEELNLPAPSSRGATSKGGRSVGTPSAAGTSVGAYGVSPGTSGVQYGVSPGGSRDEYMMVDDGMPLSGMPEDEEVLPGGVDFQTEMMHMNESPRGGAPLPDSPPPPPDGDDALAAQAAGTPADAAAKGKKKRATGKRKRAIEVDAGRTTIDSGTFEGWTKDTSDITVTRPVRKAESYGEAALEALFEGPFLTSRKNMHPSLLKLFALPKSIAKRTRFSGGDKEEASPGRREWEAQQDNAHAMVEYFDDMPPLPDADMGMGNIPEGEEVEPERLRAALSTPGGDSDTAFRRNQLGMTPGSGSGMGRSRQSSFGSGLQIDAAGGIEYSASPGTGLGGAGGSSGMGTPGTADDVLPYLSEGQDMGITQFELAETGGDTQNAPLEEAISASTHRVLDYVRERLDEADVAEEEDVAATLTFAELFGAPKALPRGRAARAFFHVLVLRSTRFVTLEQVEPYGDITVGRGEFL